MCPSPVRLIESLQRCLECCDHLLTPLMHPHRMCSDVRCSAQEQGTSNPAAVLQQLQASQASPRQQALLIRMLQDSVLGAAAREPLAARVLPVLPCSSVFEWWRLSLCHPSSAGGVHRLCQSAWI